jgi:GNAT superfamily N-acetyltransferase
MSTIRRIQVGEFEAYRTVRLLALCDAPEAFQTTYAEAEKRTDAAWQVQADNNARSDDHALFLAWDDGGAIGLAGVYRMPGEDTGELYQVWVAPEHRGSGLSQALVESVLAWAAGQGFGAVLATIRGGNDRAVRFYRTLGFTDAPDVARPFSDDTVLRIFLSGQR